MWAFILWVLLAAQFGYSSSFQNYEAAVRESDVEGRVGESVRLPCEVDKESCGAFHSIKWYKGNDRVFIFSEIAEVKRPEGSLLERTEFHYSEDRRENWLEIYPLHTEDEGKYKCEITYLAVKEACSVVQFVNLKTLARPTSFQISFEDGSLISNGSTIGPFPEGEDLSLRCQAGGAKPVPSVKWFNGTQKIQGRFQSTVDNDGLFVGSNPIQIRLSRYDLKRRISCEVFNDAMSEPVVLWAEIDVDVAPLKVTTQPHRSVVREGDKVTIHCSAKGAKPMAEISWMNGSVPIEDAETTVNIQEDTAETEMPDGTFETESKLTFDGTRFENGVPFSCQATNEVLKRKNLPPLTHNVTIDVQFAPTVTVHPENTTLNESMDFILFCEYEANPMQLTHVYWYLDDTQLDVAGRPAKYRNGNVQHSSLLVANASANDMGVYTCRVANDVGASEVTNSAYVDVQYRPEVSVVTEVEGPISEKKEMNLILVCEVIRANPSTLMKVRWYYDGQGLKELPDCDVNGMNGEFCYVDPSRLLLENVTRAFHGNYSCEGMNLAGWGPMSSQTPVIVHHKPNVTAIQYHPETVIKGYPVTLTCDMYDPGRPRADTFRWTRNSHLVPDKTSQAWHIETASLETKAKYSCVAMNSEGESRPSFVAIDVLAKPAFITRLPQYHGALMNAQDVSLTCRVECSPNCTISWMKDNQFLDNDTHYSVSNVDLPPDPESGDFESVRSTLSWKMSMWPEGHLNREKDNANYTCVSSANIAGDGVSSHTVFRVEYPPEDIKISHEVLQVKENEIPDKIGCVASGYPEPTYRWIYNEETVRTGNLLNFDFPIDRKIAGAYSCIAENRHGEMKASTTLDVMFRPECKIDRQDTGSGDSAGIILICRAYAHPEDVSFRWRMGNETLVDPVVSEGLESKLTLEAISTSLGTYYCYVNNSVGESIPCEIDVTGVAGLLETFGDDNMLLYAIIAASIIIIIIIIIILIIFCRRQQQRGKYSGSGDLRKENPDRNSNGGPFQPPQNLTSSITSAATVSAMQPTHKWPMKPGVQVHVNSLMSLADDSKPFFNLNTNTNSTTISSGSYQIHQLNQNDAQNHHSLLPVMPSNHPLQHHQQKNGKTCNSLMLQRNFPSSTLDNKRSSTTSSSTSSSSNLLSSRLSALHTLPRKSTIDAGGAGTLNGSRHSHHKWPAVPPVGADHASDHKHTHTNKAKQKPRPMSVVSEFNANFSGNSVDCTVAGLQFHSLPSTGRKRKKHSKDSDPTKKDNAPKSEASGKDPKDNGLNSPDAEGPTFYENLPFHGIQAPPNKIIIEESSNHLFTLCSSGGSRPPSEISQQASSGYGSTRSQKAQTANHNPSEEVTSKSRRDVSFALDDGLESSPSCSKFKRKDSESYGSMKAPSVKAAKGAIAKTAAYLSVRIPRKIRPQPDRRADDHFPIHPEGGETENGESAQPQSRFNNGGNSTYVTSETSHSLNAQRKSPNSIVIESTQTSTLTVHAPKNSNTETSRTTSFNTSASEGEAKTENSNDRKNPFSQSWTSEVESEANASQHAELQTQENNLQELLNLETPTPAPRNGYSQAKPTYQNIPLTKKSHKKDLTLTNECKISQPHVLHVLPEENRRKLNYEHTPSNNPSSVNGYSAADSSSSNASSPSSAQYQQPYHTSYPPQNYQSNSPPNFSNYPPVYSQPSRYHHSPSSFPALDRQYSGDYHKSSNSVQPNSKYPPPQGVSYKDHHINHNGLPNNYRDYESDYNALHFNSPVIGQEIDV